MKIHWKAVLVVKYVNKKKLWPESKYKRHLLNIQPILNASKLFISDSIHHAALKWWPANKSFAAKTLVIKPLVTTDIKATMTWWWYCIVARYWDISLGKEGKICQFSIWDFLRCFDAPCLELVSFFTKMIFISNLWKTQLWQKRLISPREGTFFILILHLDPNFFQKKVENVLFRSVPMVWLINKHKHFMTNVSIFCVTPFNAF